MSANYIINGDGSISFGAAGAGVEIDGEAPTIGYVQSASAPRTRDKWEGRDEHGNVSATVLYNENGDINCSFLLKTGVALPAVGDTVTAGGKTGVIETVNPQWTNTDGTKLDITGHWYAGIDVDAGGEGGGGGGGGGG